MITDDGGYSLVRGATSRAHTFCREHHSRHREKPDRGLRDALIIMPAVATCNLVFNFSGNKRKKKKILAITMPVFAVYKYA